jgi:thiosulfate/3-mercaptopyruvate sulfurtransferase
MWRTGSEGKGLTVSRRAEVLVTSGELEELLAKGKPVTILDVRWELTRPDGREAYAAGHLPGAVYASMEDDLTDHDVPGRGRHPLPSGRAVEAAARRWGIGADTTVVAYDDWNRAGSARAWWVLKAAGLPDVRILDGGLAAWTAAGGAIETGVVTPPPGDVAVLHDDLYAGGLPTLSADDAAALGPRLVDARAPERFRGDTEPVDPVAGHIPGATNVPSTTLLGTAGEFHADADLLRAFGDVAGVYCGSGVTAAVAVAALAAAGVDVALFPGSWSQWSGEPARPVATGG